MCALKISTALKYDLGALAIDARRRQGELHRRHSRATSSTELEVTQIMGDFVAAPRRRKREETEDEEDGVTRANHAFIVEKNTTSVLERNYARRFHAKPFVSD